MKFRKILNTIVITYYHLCSNKFSSQLQQIEIHQPTSLNHLTVTQLCLVLAAGRVICQPVYRLELVKLQLVVSNAYMQHNK